MPKKSPCTEDGCLEPRLPGAYKCASHIGDRRRCAGKVKLRDDEGNPTGETRRCKRSALTGTDFCRDHGRKRTIEVSERSKALTAMERFVAPYNGELTPLTAFENEYRRTWGRIVWLEDMLSRLKVEELTFGETKREQIAATEFAGTNITYEARIHVYEDMLRWERKHALELLKVYLKANMDERRFDAMRRYLEGTYAATIRLLNSLGVDTTEPTVREKLLKMFTDNVEAAE